MNSLEWSVASLYSLISVTRLGDFCIFLVTIFITKVAQMFGDVLGSCNDHFFLSQTGEATF